MKKLVSALLAAVMLLTFIPMGALTVSAAGDTTATATNIGFGTTYSGSITESSHVDVYKFNASSSGKITLNVTAYIGCSHWYILDADGDAVATWEKQWCNSNTQIMKLDKTIDVTKGTYYLKVKRYEYYGETYYGDYSFKLTFKTAGESFSEPQGGNNNTAATADAISLGTLYKGQIARNDYEDIYKFTIATSGKVTVNVSANIGCSHYYLWDVDGNEVASWTKQWCNSNTQTLKLADTIDVTKGTYYFAVKRYEYYGETYYGNYSFKITFKTAGESFAEPQGGNNNDIVTADKITFNTTYKGQIARNDHRDVYKFSVSTSGTFTVNVTANIRCSNYYIWDVDGNEMATWKKQWWDSNAQTLKLSNAVDLNKGTYYFVADRYEYYGETYYGNYSFSLNCNHAYKTTKVTKATLSATGKVYKKCTVCGKTTSYTVAKPTSFKLSTYTYSYNGETKTPNVIIKDSTGKTLVKNTDYTVSYASGRKNVGTYKVTVTMKGKYSGTKTMTFKIIPPKTTVAKLTPTKTTMKVYVSRKASAAATGYQIQYATNKNFTNAKTKWITKNTVGSATLTGLKSKTTQYVRVRTYKKVGSTTYYSAWSSTAYVKTK